MPKTRIDRTAVSGSATHSELEASYNTSTDTDTKNTRKTSDSDGSSTVANGEESIGSRSTSISSLDSQASLDFQMENTFLGSTSAQEFLDHLETTSNGTFTKEGIARAWILCVAAEQSDLRHANPNIDAPGVSFITTADAKNVMEFHTQRRAQLGRISLLNFLKKFDFDDNGTAAVDSLLLIFRQTALESQERVGVFRNRPAARAVRRISLDSSGSTKFRSRRSRRST